MSDPFCWKLAACNRPNGHSGPCASVPLIGSEPVTILTDSGEAYRIHAAVREAITQLARDVRERGGDFPKVSGTARLACGGDILHWMDREYPALSATTAMQAAHQARLRAVTPWDILRATLDAARDVVGVDAAASAALNHLTDAALASVLHPLPADSAAQGPTACAWTLVDDDYLVYRAGCNTLEWSFITGTRAENGVTYCPYCGKRIVDAVSDSPRQP